MTPWLEGKKHSFVRRDKRSPALDGTGEGGHVSLFSLCVFSPYPEENRGRHSGQQRKGESEQLDSRGKNQELAERLSSRRTALCSHTLLCSVTLSFCCFLKAHGLNKCIIFTFCFLTHLTLSMLQIISATQQ